ncbi:MAG: hypothetical protein HY260_19335 [Chloroflexi bacterium]|nr:hypothetical protein [Chloroflexota bacterium]
MAQWYAQLVFKGDTLIGEGLTDFALVEGVVSPNGGERYTTVIVSGYALYGQLRGYYSLGVAHLAVDAASGRAAYISQDSALHKEEVSTLTTPQRAAIREWLVSLSPTAWENSTEMFKSGLFFTGEDNANPKTVPA